MLVSLTVGKVDAGVTVLLTPDKRLIEFPSILLPPNITSGSIVDITVARNSAAESAADKQFSALQDRIFGAFGAAEPATPVLRCRNATQTSVVLEWDPMELATANLISLSLFRNGQKAGNIPRPLQMHSTKISGLAVDTEYTFHLVLRTTAGTFASKQVNVRTHKMTDLSGITITTGILPAAARENLNSAVERIGAKIADSVRIDTTHFVTTEGRGVPWEKAVEMNIPVVRPEWVEACERSGRILGVTKFYLDAVRPGPGDVDEVRSPPVQSQPASNSTPSTTTLNKDKDLPAEPEKGKAEDDEASSATDPSASKVAGNNEDEDDDEDDEDEPEKARAADAEQKVRLEDKDTQKVALRPGGEASQNGGGNPNPTAHLEDEDEKSAAPSPGDGASFQDVAL
ncbi:BRCA1 C terminus domain-containing protein [Microdochium trichocladiopsis]|uniref:BRCA1 C terminus domain-containing protein n=1 Tax=Microdochium trichocladiopsis TaxID=1682393 RepID=A0A9P8YEG0_9PEZI|nr:BRCA1 C terminus domain-containing protein [Microdochium trichocladiopsis]KAH7037382.1 BRCA1 C terminus domain-containing protein [Microdochium trichocladiopsis]